VDPEVSSVVGSSDPEALLGLPDDGVTGELVRALREARRWNARITGLVAVAEKRDLARKQGYPSTTEWLMALSGEPASICRSKVAVAAALEEMPATREAFAAGEVSETRVRLLAQAQALAPEQFTESETALLAQVTAAPTRQVPKVLAQWKRTADPQGAEAQAERLRALRALHLSEDWSGMLRLSGLLDPESGLIVMQALQALTDPVNLDPADTRSPAQARADALVEVCRRYAQADEKGRRRPAQVLVTIPWNTLQTGEGPVDTEAGTISGGTARRLCCDATISRVLLDPDSVPVEMGRATRTITPGLRKTLELRDQHCTHPGCDIPARWCDAHHQQHWAEGGTTDLTNLQLLCTRHHTLAHQEDWHPKRE
jgi:hypothetical protein